MSLVSRVIIPYAIFSTIWILLGDVLLFALLDHNQTLLLRVSNIKGVLFALLSIALLWWLVQNVIRQRDTYTHDLQLLFSNNPQPMWVFDRETLAFLAVNDAAVKQYGYTHDEFLRMRLTDMHPPQGKYLPPERDPTNPLHPLYIGKRNHVTKLGELLMVEIFAHDLIYDGKVARLSVIHDVTEQVMLQDERTRNEALRLQLQTEREAHEARSRFASMVSHEFRTPIAAITTSASLIHRYNDRLSPEKLMNNIEMILERSRQLDTMLDDMLAVLRSESERSAFRPVITDVKALCQAAVDEMQSVAGSTSTIYFDAPEKNIQAQIDTELIQRVMRNLLSNAVKYSPPNSAVHLHLSEDDGCIELAVQDYGIGIPPDDLVDLFQPFKRATNVGEIPGTGLGLVIVKQAVEYHSGEVHVESVQNEGTTFTVSLPKRQQDRSALI